MSCRVLIVEDEPGLVLMLRDRLQSEGYLVESAGDGESGLERATREPFDLIVLDVRLPGINGFDVCRDLRRRNVQTPVLMLTARDQLLDKVLGLKLGADDYLTKPFHMLELLARLEALRRRTPPSGPAPAEAYSFGDIQVDLRRAEVWRDSQNVELSAKEYQLLCYFIAHRGATLSRDELLDAVWGYDATPVTRTVDVHVSGLRKKVEANPERPRYILTIHGLGYKFAG
jgi:two-component system, OmpR family, alkaline phosphatase synthesis response regulator PhoP